MKAAVVYYSLEGNTRYAAEKVAEALNADVIEIRPKKAYPDQGFKKFLWGGKAAAMKEKPELEPYNFKSEDYDLVVLCTPVWAGTMTPPLRSFLAENDLSLKQVAALASCSGGNTEKCLAQLREASGAGALVAQVGLVDPKARPSEENERLLADFIEELNELH